ncbi:MFS transporter [Nonomuraea roseoviolacea subsp. roseoviolacea]|uniref:DHA1 family inner membrane transport protein n=1 Tax=Nonomuraea roseoviolacea subsp. carminata TaxID=160689 RepID=A0ABT1JYQ0_9ACTN|nr:MFS transporter [Nonomuraea roseoviolacea]MCP2345919.1 DHA1 family inner membrane transport protein [Nonomuraea roseoviolacea subsp. carminata]
MPLALFALAISAFGIGTTEFIINGLLPELAADFGVTIPTAGLLVSGYALGVAVGGPPLTMLGGRLPRKTMLLALMVLFIAGNLLSALAPSYGVLMVGRVLAAFAHGAYFGVGSVVAADLVAPQKRASAIALMFTGLTLANVAGVPVGTWVGQSLGWRATFWLVVVIGVVGFAGVLALVPRRPRPEGGVLRELATFRSGAVWLALAMTVFGFAPVFAVITFVAPMMTDVGGFSAGAVPVVMALFGVGLVVGNLLGGRLADRAVMPAIYGSVGLLTVLAVVIALVARNQIAFMVVITLFGVAGFATVPPLQTRVLDAAAGAPTLASAANIGAFNVGNAIGSFAAGLTIEAGLGYVAPAWTAGLLGVAGLAVAAVAGFHALRVRTRGQDARFADSCASSHSLTGTP